MEQPDVPNEYSDLPNLCPDVDNEDLPYDAQDCPEDGDHMFMATIPSEEAFIRASSTTSQCLAEAFHKNSQPKSFHKTVPNHLHDLI